MTYGHYQGKILLPFMLTLLTGLLQVILEVNWFPAPLPSLLALVASVLLWIWFYLWLWRYQPVPEENPARVRTFQIGMTLLSLAILSLCTFSWFVGVVFNRTGPFALGALWFGIFIPSLLGCVLMFWRDYRLRREEASQRAEHS
jgi:hypothetical protein